jgi:RHH-type proline utilization regulon transcriptional repressor/proline dehydrogenase/delta 1-pyrroline-5-carboxylate dehydrogenase
MTTPQARPDRLAALRQRIRQSIRAEESALVPEFINSAHLSPDQRARITAQAADLVRRIRTDSRPSMMEQFLSEYGLSTQEGIALMCLAEAVLRVPDDRTIDALIRDKVAGGKWAEHLNRSSSTLVNASTWALMMTGQVVEDRDAGLAGVLRGMVRRLGEPVVRTAVEQAMREMGRTFVLGADMDEALNRAKHWEAEGYTYSYDMLGEAARTDADARAYHLSYADAISRLAPHCTGDVADNPGISVKLSALHARYEYAQKDRVMRELTPRLMSLALLAKSANMGFNIDAEEADRLDLSLDVIETVMSDPATKGWDGFGVVVQAYGRRAKIVLDWVHALAEREDRRIMVRLVKGAYWDTEIKHAQVNGEESFPVLTRKASTDVCFIACARQLFGMTDRIYPQFATHNAHTAMAILDMARETGAGKEAFEFQRLHGMGEALHSMIKSDHDTRCRIYAPVGAHRDLLAYLVRRLLENGANSSFVNQIVDEDVPPEDVARDPFTTLERLNDSLPNPHVVPAPDLYAPSRRNSRGWDLTEPLTVGALHEQMAQFRAHEWHSAPVIARQAPPPKPARTVVNPAVPADEPGKVEDATPEHARLALDAAEDAAARWSAEPVEKRAEILEAISDAYESHAAELFAIAAREAGKTLADGVAEVREAVDFLRYYAAEARRLYADAPLKGRGVFVCISPWNFPLAIFTGQIAAALAAGNAVIAKPAEQTSLMAARAVALMHEHGIPRDVLQLLPGDGAELGGALLKDRRVSGVCFTGSTETAKIIDRTIAEHCAPGTPLIAETGGLNAMILDSTALPEQAVRDVVQSAFQSAGQRCSSLRCLYIQEDVFERTVKMLSGAMDELRVGDPWDLSTDVGPVIDADAQRDIGGYCAKMEADGRLLKKIDVPFDGRFVAPSVFRVSGIEELEREVFGPVLHVAPFKAANLKQVVETINASGYGLTAGLHTRIDRRVQEVVDRLEVGNIYVNRNQIGSIVGSQPFGGEKCSGTGPKAGGPHYLMSFRKPPQEPAHTQTQTNGPMLTRGDFEKALDDAAKRQPAWEARTDRLGVLEEAIGNAPALARDALTAASSIPHECVLPGPTGESNRMTVHPRGTILCLGPDAEIALAQAAQALAFGNAPVIACTEPPDIAALTRQGAPITTIAGRIDAEWLADLDGFAGVACAGDEAALRAMRRALARRDGPILPLITDTIRPDRYFHERHLCVDTTAAGGNAALLAQSD